MHEVIATEGVVLQKRATGESSSKVLLLSKDLGLVRASAKSARKEVSKLRYGLEPLTRGTYSLIRGKYEWKVTGVEALSQEYLRTTPEGLQATGRVVKLLLRLVQGEEPVPALYEEVVRGFALLCNSQEHSLESVEVVLVLRILSHLGYLPHTEALAPFVEEEFSLELSAKALLSRALLIRTINASLQSTGL
jgi:DNA repair protein RecO